MKTLRRLFSITLTTYLVTFCLVVAFAAIQPIFEPKQFAPADRIIVLGAGMDPDGTLHKSAMLRVEKGGQLCKSGAAQKIHFSGGIGKPNGLSAGHQMAQYAIELGVPAQATSYEGLSQSTLQNALFSASYLKEDNRIILVTEGFHLARSWASMKLFGSYEIALAHSVAFRQSSPSSKMPQITMCLREALAIWFNAMRYIIWKLAPMIGIDDTARNTLLY
jgi:uncharacterized SAM-binding protein YcdF (DUF218 family)